MSVIKSQRQEGFTIVELLVVIVVIAILAAITIVVYGGMQQRAKVARKSEAVHSVQQKMEIYKTLNGSYTSPYVSGDPYGFGSLQNEITTGPPPAGSEPWGCYDEGVTRDKPCVVSDNGQKYVIFWWNDTTKTWWYYYKNGATSVTNQNNGTNGWPDGFAG